MLFYDIRSFENYDNHQFFDDSHEAFIILLGWLWLDLLFYWHQMVKCCQYSVFKAIKIAGLNFF